MIKDCNRCNRGTQCRGASNMKNMVDCKRFIAPYDTWKLAELVLAHPTNLNKALSALPFKTNIDFYLEGRNNGRK